MRKRIMVIVGIIVLIIAVPLVVDWGIIGNSVISNIDNSDWVGFLGSYIGAIIGGIVSMIGISITIRSARAENEKIIQLEREFRTKEQEIELHRMVAELFYTISQLKTTAIGEYTEKDEFGYRHFIQTDKLKCKMQDEALKILFYSRLRMAATHNISYFFGKQHEVIEQAALDITEILAEAIRNQVPTETKQLSDNTMEFSRKLGTIIVKVSTSLTEYADGIVK